MKYKLIKMKSESQASKPEGHTRVQWAVAGLVSMTVFTYGLQCGWVSPMSKILQSPESPVGRPLTDTEISLIAGIPSLSAIVGIIILVYIVDTFGRKCAIFIMATFQLMCWVIKLCPSNPTSLMAARLVAGFGAGGCFHVVPMYIKEISSDNIRGTLGSMNILAQNVAILTMYAIGGYLDYYTVLYLVIGLPVVTIAMLFKAPESPSFLVKVGKLEEASANIALLRGLDVNHKEVQAVINSIKSENDHFNSIPNISFCNIFKEKAWRRGFLIMVMIITIHALNGSFSIVNYASILLADSEINISPELQSLAIPVFLSIGTTITMSSVDRFGRKLILGTTFVLSTLTFAVLASSIFLRDHGWATPGWLPIVLILLTVCCYGAGISPIPFIIMSEVFNFQVRAKLMACLCILAWFMSFIQLTSFTAITGSLGAHVSFFIFAGLNLLGAVIVIVLLPETQGKSVEQIERELRRENIVDEKNIG